MKLFKRRAQHDEPALRLPAWIGETEAAALRAAREHFTDIEHNGKVVGYSQPDWNRLALATMLLPRSGGRHLEIGPGPGVLLTTMHLLDPSCQLSAVDIRRHSMLRAPDGVDFHIASISQPGLAADLGSFDCVICMEVLEHLEVDDLTPAVDNLRQLTGGRLIATVPFEEPEPVWWHDRPGGHRQSFSRERLESLFPRAATTRLARHGVDWIFLVEDDGADYGFAELDHRQFLDRVGTGSPRP